MIVSANGVDLYVEVHGEGKGKYIFGVWAKPK